MQNEQLAKSSIRKQLRQRRRSLSPQEQAAAARRITFQALQINQIRFANSVAVYFAQDGEISLAPLIDWLWSHNKTVLLPVLHPFDPRGMWFVPYCPDNKLQMNRFGIPEPMYHPSERIRLERIDVVLTPLVGFDRFGNRLGMGGGFYDKTFSRRKKLGITKPKLFGAAHGFQQIDALPTDDWDAPLDGLITDLWQETLHPPK